jgi:hypothetical protein
MWYRLRQKVVYILLVALSSGAAFTPTLRVRSGSAIVWKQASGNWITVVDTISIARGDTIVADSAVLSVLSIEQGTDILMKGECRIIVSEIDTQSVIELESGRIFFEHTLIPNEVPCKFIVRGCTAVPIGTAAAIQITRRDEPSVAVVDGNVAFIAKNGHSATIPAGEYATFDPIVGLFKQATLSEQAMEGLQQWAEAISDREEQMKQTPETTEEPQQESEEESRPEQEAAGEKSLPEKKETEKPAAKSNAGARGVGETPEKEKEEKPAGEKEKPRFEISAGVATVENEQWTRIAFGVDVPVWKFGVFFDLELFIDAQGQFSDKGWRFTKEDWIESVMRKIRYIRFGHENDPLFIKVGGLSDVTLGYGFIMDRFTNMLHYPDKKLIGLQFYLNDLTPVGLTFQSVIADFNDFRRTGGVIGTRLGFKPLKVTNIPIVNGITLAGMFAIDLNQYAPAYDWNMDLHGDRWDEDEDGKTDSIYLDSTYGDHGEVYDSIVAIHKEDDDYDTKIEHKDQWAQDTLDRFYLVGGDIGIPIIKTSLLNLDIYGQGAKRLDGKRGWGIGAPGVWVGVGKLWAALEYRHIQGMFTPAYFGTYYLDERLERSPAITTKEQRLDNRLSADHTLDGVFGKLGFNVMDVIVIEGNYQYMVGKKSKKDSVSPLDQRIEGSVKVGDMIVSRIPKINRVEGYVQKKNIMRAPMYDKNGNQKTDSNGDPVYDTFFEKTPYLYYGFRVGVEIAPGATVIWDSRYGYAYNTNNVLESNNNIMIQTVISFWVRQLVYFKGGESVPGTKR